MEHEDEFPCSQKLATSLYCEPDDSNPHPPTLFSKIHFNIILVSPCRYFKRSAPLGFPTKTLYAFRIYPMLTTCPSHLTLIWSDHHNKIWCRTGKCSSSLCSFLQPLVISFHLGPDTLFSILLSQSDTQSVFPLNTTEQVSHSHKPRSNIIVLYLTFRAGLCQAV